MVRRRDAAGRRAVLANGHPWMTRVTGVGCSASALVGAFADGDPLSVVVMPAGATGGTGAQGADGGIRWTYDSSTTIGDPGTCVGVGMKSKNCPAMSPDLGSLQATSGLNPPGHLR